jgi:hypothetical protein
LDQKEVVDLSSMVPLIFIVIIFFTSLAMIESLKQTYKLSFLVYWLIFIGMLVTTSSSSIIITIVLYQAYDEFLCLAYLIPIFIVGTLLLIFGIRLSRKSR